MANTPQEWFENLPLITKSYLTAAVLTTALITFGTITPYQIYLDFNLIFKKFEIWRLVTNFLFFGKFSFKFVFQMFILQSYTSMLERERFQSDRYPRGKAEIIHMFMFGAILMILISYLMGGLPFLGQPLIFMNLYVWSRTNPIRDTKFWSFDFKAWHLPFLLMVIGMLMGGSPVNDIIGILVGHVYVFFMQIVPRKYGVHLLKCPEFLLNYFDPPNVRVQRLNNIGTGYSLRD